MTEGYTPPPPLTEGYTPPPLIEGYTPQQQQYSQSIVTLLYFGICRFLIVGNIFRLETCMNSLVKVSPYSKLDFQGKISSPKTGVILL
jgi:hypothetical protein